MTERSDLPNGWSSLALGECGLWLGGGTPSKSNNSYWHGGNIPWISPKDMKSFLLSDSEDHITKAALAETSVRSVPAGSVLMVIRSGILNRTFPVAVSEALVTINQDLKAIHPHDWIASRYLAYFLKGSELRILRLCSKAGTTVASIELPLLKRVLLPLPPLREQQRIVAKLDELLTNIDRVAKILHNESPNLLRLRQSILKAAFEGKLVPQDPNDEPASALLARIQGSKASEERTRKPRRKARSA